MISTSPQLDTVSTPILQRVIAEMTDWMGEIQEANRALTDAMARVFGEFPPPEASGAASRPASESFEAVFSDTAADLTLAIRHASRTARQLNIRL